MKTIYKYVLPFMEIVHIDLPKGAEVIRCDGIEGFIYIWCVIDTEAPLEKRTFYLFKTGAKIDDNLNLKYLGCGAIFIQMELMMYIFESKDPWRPYSATSTVC